MVGIAATGQSARVDITSIVRRKVEILGSYGGRPGQTCLRSCAWSLLAWWIRRQ
jgi:hypothetical protein